MTKEQIGEVEWLLANKVFTVTTHATVARLLEERKRLLAAAKIEPHCCGQAAVEEDHKTIAAAIAFAEEPAR